MADLVIPYNSQPDYDEWGSDTFWPLATWVAWHRGLVKKYGRSLNPGGYPFADAIWLNAWSKQSYGASPLLAIGQPSRFKEETDYLKKFPLLYEYTGLKKHETGINPIDATYKLIQKSATALQDLGEGVTDTISGVGSGLSVLKYAIPVVLVIVIGTGLYIGYKKLA